MRVSIESASTLGWFKYLRNCDTYQDLAIGIDSFGISGKGTEVMEALGMNAHKIVERIKDHINEHREEFKSLELLSNKLINLL